MKNKRIVHIIKDAESRDRDCTSCGMTICFRNMLCEIDACFTKDTWILQHELETGVYSLDAVSCDHCKDLYPLLLLAKVD